METVKLNIKDWDEVCYALRSKGRELEKMGLGEETKVGGQTLSYSTLTNKYILHC